MATPAATSLALAVILLLVAFTAGAGAATFSITNRCPFPVCAAAMPVSGGGGAQLAPGETRTLTFAAGGTGGRIWPRTGCARDAGRVQPRERRRPGQVRHIGRRRLHPAHGLLLQRSWGRRRDPVQGPRMSRRKPPPRRRQVPRLPGLQRLQGRLLPMIELPRIAASVHGHGMHHELLAI